MNPDLPDDALARELAAAFATRRPDPPALARLERFARTAPAVVRRARLRRVSLTCGGLLVASAGAAAAIAPNGFRVGGVAIFVEHADRRTTTRAAAPKTPTTRGATVATIPGDARVWPGEPVTLAEATRRYRSRILLPSVLPGPRALFWLIPPDSGQINAVWAPTTRLPASNDPKVGLLLTQFRGTATAAPVLTKSQVGVASTYEQIEVNGASGVWIAGPHEVRLTDSRGARLESPRVAANTLLWAVAPFTYRIEGALGKEEALRIARSIR